MALYLQTKLFDALTPDAFKRAFATFAPAPWQIPMAGKGKVRSVIPLNDRQRIAKEKRHLGPTEIRRVIHVQSLVERLC